MDPICTTLGFCVGYSLDSAGFPMFDMSPSNFDAGAMDARRLRITGLRAD